MGIRALRQIQIGEETDKGTAVAATAGLAGVLTMRESPTIHRPTEERGQMAEFSRSVKVANLADLTFEGDATFEQILYWLHMGILGNVTPGAGNANKIWTFLPAMAAAGAYDSFTIEYGDDVQAWETEFCMARTIEISGNVNEPLRVRCDMFGRKMSTTTFTPDKTVPTVETIAMQKSRIFIDAENGTIGATEVSNLLNGLTLVITTGLEPKRHADGSIDFTTYAEKFKGVELKASFAYTSDAEAERAKFDGSTMRLVRIEFQGSDITALASLVESGSTVVDDPLAAAATTLNVTDGTDFVEGQSIRIEDEYLRVTAIVTNALTVIRGIYGSTDVEHAAATVIKLRDEKRLTLDMCGVYTDIPSISERDGEDILEVTLSGQRGANYTKLFEVVVANAVATLP